MAFDAIALQKRFDDLVTKRKGWEPTWRELAEFILPNKPRVNEQRQPGAKQTERLYDTTAPDANRKLAAFLQGALTSASTRFFSMITRDPALLRIHEVAVWLDDSATRMYQALQQSNFKAKVTAAYQSVTGMGTMALVLEERDLKLPGFNGLRFTGIPVGYFVAEENAEGMVTTFGREFHLSAIAAVGKFGLEACPKYIQDTYQAKPYERYEFRHLIMERKMAGGMTKTKLPFASYYWDCRDKTPLQEGGYHEQPMMVARWMAEDGEPYGKGSGHIGLPDIRSLNKLKELGLQAATLAVRPPLQVPHDGVLGGQVRLTPAAQNVLTGDREIKPLELGGNLQIETMKVEQLRAAIQGVFYRDLVALPDKNYMTATEILKQLDLIHRELGPTLGQLEQDFLNPMLERVFGLMWRAGAFLPPPPELAGADLDIEYEGPLARAQRSGDLTALQEALALVAGIGQHDPEAMDNIDTDENVRYIWEVSGNPTRLMRKPSAIASIRKARADAAQMKMQQESAQANMDIADTAASAAAQMGKMQPAGASA